MKMQPQCRNRGIYAVLIVLVIVLGLSSRRWSYMLPPILQKNAGDMLWALMVFLLVGLINPRRSTLSTALTAMAFSAVDEFSQLYHAPWIDTIRATFIGHLILGSGFSWIDMLDYAIGIALGACLEIVCSWRQSGQTRK